MMSDPIVIPIAVRLVILTMIVVLCLAFSRMLHTFKERSEHRIPAYRRELEATYASFRRFLLSVRSAVLMRLHQ